MIRFAAFAIVLVSAGFQEKKVEHPPYRIVVTAKTKFARWKESYTEFQERVKKTNPHARLVGREAVSGDNAGWERWIFEVAAVSKLDIGLFPRVFGDMKIGTMELTIHGTATVDVKTKTVFVTSFGDKVKVKLLNRPKKDFNDTPEDRIEKIRAAINEGKEHFVVTGEPFSHGGQFAIWLESFQPAAPPAR